MTQPEANAPDQSPMPGFSPELAQKIINVMLHLDQFNSDSSLRAVFITTDLAELKNGIPEGNSKYDRVHKVMKWIAETGKKDKVLAFLQTMEARYQTGDGIKTDLQKLITEIRQMN